MDDTLGDRIVAAYTRAGLNRNQFAKALGAQYGNVIKWENNKGKPDADSFAKIAEVTGVSLDWLIRGEKAPVEVRVVERDLPASFAVWREQMAPPDLSPETARRMLETHFRFPPDEAYRWGQVYDLVRTEMSGRAAPAGTADTEDAGAVAKRAGLKKLAKRKKR